MEHHYALTGRMRAIFIVGLMLLGLLLLATGILIGREWGFEDAKALQGTAGKSEEPLKAGASGAVGTGVIRPAETPGANPDAAAKAPAAPAALPALPPLPPVPAPATVPAAPLKSGSASQPLQNSGTTVATRSDVRETAVPDAEKLPRAGGGDTSSAAKRRTSTSSSPTANRADTPDARKAASVTRGREEGRGYVVYAGVFDRDENADALVEQLRARNLKAQTSMLERPGQRSRVAVWVGMFDERSDAQAARNAIREAGVAEPVIKWVQ